MQIVLTVRFQVVQNSRTLATSDGSRAETDGGVSAPRLEYSSSAMMLSLVSAQNEFQLRNCLSSPDVDGVILARPQQAFREILQPPVQCAKFRMSLYETLGGISDLVVP